MVVRESDEDVDWKEVRLEERKGCEVELDVVVVIEIGGEPLGHQIFDPVQVR